MTAVWTSIGVVALVNFLIKAIGPVAYGGKPLPPRLAHVVELLAPALLAGLVVVDTFSAGQSVVLDARLAGVAAAAVALAFRAHLGVVVLVAPLATAAVRALGWG